LLANAGRSMQAAGASCSTGSPLFERKRNTTGLTWPPSLSAVHWFLRKSLAFLTVGFVYRFALTDRFRQNCEAVKRRTLLPSVPIITIS
jgi:hypothetical protein